MMIVYDKITKKLVSFTGSIFDNGTWREPKLEEIYPKTDVSNWDVVYVKDAIHYACSLDELELKFDKGGIPIGVKFKYIPKIHVKTDAVDNDRDGLPELAADGVSKAHIKLEVKDTAGKLVKQDFELQISTTGGSLSKRRLTAKGGKAAVELTSSTQTVTATVTASGAGLETGSITFEFMPSD